MSDASNVDAALLATLSGDATLAGLMPDGVFFDIAPPNKTRFVIVSQVIYEDTHAMGETAYEMGLYLVKAVARDDGQGSPVKAAAARIHALLHQQDLTITGYSHMVTLREERVRYTEVDSVDHDVRWQHRGGRYAIWVSPQE